MVKREWIWPVLLAALLTLLSAPAMAQETIRGYFEGPVDGANSGTGAVALTGWALAESGVARVTIQVNGKDIGQAIYGRARPDVEAAFPGFPDSEGAGFTYELNTTQFTNGVHSIAAKVRSFDGAEQVITNQVAVFFNNNTSILVPFGEIDFPQRAAELYGTCDRTSPNRIYSFVSGWALDLGVEIGDAGIGDVQILVDGATKAIARRDCVFIRQLGGLVNCYGLPRLDIERRFPFALDAPLSGFRFALDIGDLIVNQNLAEGRHTLTIIARDVSTQQANIDEIPVNFFCAENTGNTGSIGVIEKPGPGRNVAGETVIQGWAVDIDGVRTVTVYIDGVEIGEADYGVDSRPAVQRDYAGFPDAGAPVWRILWDSTTVSEGFHQVEIRVRDERGRLTVAAEQTFFVDNQQP